VLYLAGTTRNVAIVHGEIEVIATDSVDRSGDLCRERTHGHDRSTPTKIAQQEPHAETRSEF